MGQAYEGRWARTVTAEILVSSAHGMVVAERYVSVAAGDEAGAAVRRGDHIGVATTRAGQKHRISQPVYYHDAERELFVIVVPETAADTVLSAKADCLARLHELSESVPHYVVNAAVVLGCAGLTSLLVMRGTRASVPAVVSENQQQTWLRELADPQRRAHAATELCKTRDVAALPAIFEAIDSMTRAEALRVLGTIARFGSEAEPALRRATVSPRSYVRQGAAIALSVSRTSTAISTVIDLLTSEPTEIWREVARAVGVAGPVAVEPLLQRAGLAPTERLAWALAHVAARGSHSILSPSGEPTAAVREVLEAAAQLVERAATDQLSAAGGSPEVTLNRAFTERLLGQIEPAAAVRQTGEVAALTELDLMELEEISDAELI